MLLLRHNRLLPPYHDYTALTPEQLDDLALNRVSPDIAALPDTLPFDAEVTGKIAGADFIVCSSSPRTAATARALLKRLSLDKDLRIDPRLDEIAFTPTLLMASPDDNPLAAVRDNLYAEIARGGKGAENSQDLEKRIRDFTTDYTGQNAVLFSHGFLMRLLKACAKSPQDFDAALHQAREIKPIDYLTAHNIDLSH